MLPARLLAGPASRLAAAIAAGVLAVALLAGAVRVMPLLLAPAVPLGVAPALARGVLGVALETALVVAPPLGWALAAARLVDRGEARALFAAGVRPARIVASAWPAALGVAAAAGIAALSWGREAVAPGRLVRDLLADGRAACIAAQPPAAIDVPLVGISWVCTSQGGARAIGPAPLGDGEGALGLAPSHDPARARIAAFSARSLEVSDDLRSLAADDLTLVLPPTEGNDGARLHATRASLRGLAPIGRASNLSVAARAALISASAAAFATAAAALVLLASIRARAAALAIGASGPAASLLVFSALERAPSSPIAYLAVPAAGLAALALAAIIARAAASPAGARLPRPWERAHER